MLELYGHIVRRELEKRSVSSLTCSCAAGRDLGRARSQVGGP